MEEPKLSYSDKFVLYWCEANGWTEPQKVNQEWWAIAPCQFVPQPVCPSQQWKELVLPNFEKNLESVRAIAVAVPEAFRAMTHPDSFFMQTIRNINVAAVNRKLDLEAFDSVCRRYSTEQSMGMDVTPIAPLPFVIVDKLQLETAMRQVSESFQVVADSYCQAHRQKPPEPESPQERIKQRDKRNQQTMRTFLKNKIGGDRY